MGKDIGMGMGTGMGMVHSLYSGCSLLRGTHLNLGGSSSSSSPHLLLA